MKFSIVTPVYNAEKYLKNAIESIINQEFLDWELILINDGSKDNSEIICKEYQKSDSRIKYIYQENQGPLEARINGINYSVGDYIMFMDADDFYEKSALNVIHNNLVNHKKD